MGGRAAASLYHAVTVDDRRVEADEVKSGTAFVELRAPRRAQAGDTMLHMSIGMQGVKLLPVIGGNVWSRLWLDVRIVKFQPENTQPIGTKEKELCQ